MLLIAFASAVVKEIATTDNAAGSLTMLVSVYEYSLVKLLCRVKEVSVKFPIRLSENVNVIIKAFMSRVYCKSDGPMSKGLDDKIGTIAFPDMSAIKVLKQVK